MTRRIKIASSICEVSKNEAKEVSRLLVIDARKRYDQWLSWFNTATTDEAKKRRLIVGIALGFTALPFCLIKNETFP